MIVILSTDSPATHSSGTGDPTSDDHLDQVFGALANRTRRRMLVRLAERPATISDLAEPFEMSLPGASKHLRVLEKAGLVRREVDGRIHRCSFQAEPLSDANTWLTQTRQFWDQKLDQLSSHFDPSAK